jgi:hypothetical protein
MAEFWFIQMHYGNGMQKVIKKLTVFLEVEDPELNV